MKKLILTALSSVCLMTISTHAYSMDTMSGNSSQMMEDKQMNMTEKDVTSHLSSQDKIIFDKLNAEQKAFVLKMINTAPQMRMMHQKMKDGQGQMQQDQGMNHGTMQQDNNMYTR